MKKLLFIIFFLVCRLVVLAQTTATNFTASDCNSTSHTLFTELNNGKVVVLVWIMPCGTCIAGAKAAYDAVQSFASSHPGKVLYYLIDDVGDASCTTLANWASANGVGPANLTIFSNAGTPINENDFGGSGMPHVAVIGGTDHKIFYNKFDNATYDFAGIKNAINQAMIPTGINTATEQAGFKLNLYPNPATDKVTVHYNLTERSEVAIGVFNSLGINVKSVKSQQIHGSHSLVLDVDNMPNGFYYLSIEAGGKSQTVGLNINN